MSAAARAAGIRWIEDDALALLADAPRARPAAPAARPAAVEPLPDVGVRAAAEPRIPTPPPSPREPDVGVYGSAPPY